MVLMILAGLCAVGLLFVFSKSQALYRLGMVLLGCCVLGVVVTLIQVGMRG